MLEQGVSEINLGPDENDVFRNGSEQPHNTPVIVDHGAPTNDSGYIHFDPTVSKSFMVSVDNPQKVGDGISSYVVYQVHFEGFAPPFEGLKSSVCRRFSEFINIHEKLVSKYLPNGIIVPPAPGKDLIGTTRLKISKNVYLENEFVERRRFALQRFLTRLLRHPDISSDKDLLDFIQQSESPRNSTQLISSTTAKRFIKNLGDAFGKMSYKMDDTDDLIVDEFFHMKADELTAWDQQLRRLHSALAALGAAEQEFASTKYAESRAVASLANVEEHTGLARALARLSSTEEQISQVQATQANSQVVHLVECVVDLLDMIQVCKDVLMERVKAYRTWKNTEALLRNKREQKVTMELTGKADKKKLNLLDVELNDLCRRVEEEEYHFHQVSKTIKTELEMFDVNRFVEFKKAAIEHLEVMYCAQSKLLGYWEAYLANANSID